MVDSAKDASVSGFGVLVVEDDPDILELVRYNLQREGMRPREALTGEAGLRQARAERPDLILLDIMLPGLDGLSLLRQLRLDPELKEVPIILLTARSEESDVVLGLGLGADDYVAKPFSPRELMARIHALLRRSRRVDEGDRAWTQHDAPRPLRAGAVSLDPDRYEVRVGGSKVDLTLAEFRLLATLIARPGRVFTREQLLDRMVGGDVNVIDRNVDVHIRAIRKKFGDAGDCIETVRGVGYRLREEERGSLGG